MELAGKSILTALPPLLAANANSLKVNVLQIFLHLYKCRVHPIFFQESKKKRVSVRLKSFERRTLWFYIQNHHLEIDFELSDPFHTFHFGENFFQFGSYTVLEWEINFELTVFTMKKNNLNLPQLYFNQFPSLTEEATIY